MTTTDIAVREQQTVRLSTDQLQYIAHTEFVPKGMRGKLPQILACIAMGRELGLGDMVALNTIHVIDGRASLSAEAMVSLVRKRGHSIQGNFSGNSCTVTGKRADNGDEMSVTWTKEMAAEAGLLGKDNYKKYRPAMLWARAVSQLCRMLFADCFAGGTYTPDELAAGGDVAEFEDSVGEPQAEATTATEPHRSTVSAAAGADQPSPADVSDAGAAGPAPSPLPGEPPASDIEMATPPQKKKLNVLVGTLREAGRITTPMVWQAVGRDPMPSEDGELHWSPLRDSLTKHEASDLIERLDKFEQNLRDQAA